MKQKNSSFIIEDKDDNVTIITIPHGIYSKEAVLKTCYKYSDVAFVKVQSLKKTFLIEVKPKDNNKHARMMSDQLCNDLIDFELRVIIASQTKEIRSALVAKAFST